MESSIPHACHKSSGTRQKHRKWKNTRAPPADHLANYRQKTLVQSVLMGEMKAAPDSSFLETCGTAEARVYCRSPVAKAMPRQAVKPVMARTSSKLPAAISKVGMPCSTPKPSFWSRSMEGTTTAGDTAPSTKLQSRGRFEQRSKR